MNLDRMRENVLAKKRQFRRWRKISFSGREPENPLRHRSLSEGPEWFMGNPKKTELQVYREQKPAERKEEVKQEVNI